MTSNVITLKSGITVPLAAAQLALDLELRGMGLTLDGGAVLITGAVDRATDEDRAQVQRWQAALASIVRYVDAQEHEQ